MTLTNSQTIIMIIAVALGAIATRFAPFILFSETRKRPKSIEYLGKMLPPAMMGLLVIYCLKSVSFVVFPHGIPEAIAIVVIVILHKWKGNALISIGAGTMVYMLLVQTLFA